MSSLAQAWETLATHLELSNRLDQQPRVEVDAPVIKQVTGWEPRLLMKMDSRSQRPPALARLQATILPVRNGRYAIVASDGYHDLEEAPPCTSFHLSESARGLQTLPWDTIPSSESQVLDMALASGMLHDFLGESRLALTIRGRLRSPAFSFHLRSHRGGLAEVQVEGVQIEVDAGLEGKGVHLLEAKLGKRSDFHLRQLYYPYRMWTMRVTSKPVSAVFCAYHDRQFFFWQYVFRPQDHYHGVHLLASASYSLDPEVSPPAWHPIVRDGLHNARVTPDVPFPQADSLERVIDLVEALAHGEQSLYGFSERQAGYYLNAARYLGLVERDGLSLSRAGQQFVLAGRHARHIQLLQAMLQRPVLREALGFWEGNGELPTPAQVQEWLTEHTPLGGTTLRRRAGTVLSWLRWVRSNFLDVLFCP